MKHNFVELTAAEMEEVSGGCFACIFSKITGIGKDLFTNISDRIKKWFSC